MLIVESTSDFIIEYEFSIEFVTDSELNNYIFLSEPTTKALDSHSHEDSLRSSTLVVLLVLLLLSTIKKFDDILC